MARIPIYRHSILASLLSIVAYLMMLGGVATAFGGSILGGIVLFVLGMGVTMLGSFVGERTKCRAIIRQIKKKGLERQLRSDIQACAQAYNLCPGNGMLRYIRSVNPQAADFIGAQLAAKKADKRG